MGQEEDRGGGRAERQAPGWHPGLPVWLHPHAKVPHSLYRTGMFHMEKLFTPKTTSLSTLIFIVLPLPRDRLLALEQEKTINFQLSRELKMMTARQHAGSLNWLKSPFPELR